VGRGSAIEDHAVVGDGRSAALVDRQGAVTWLAWPRFDSPALLAAILDPARGGHLRVAPAGPSLSERAYLDGTNVLVTRFEGGGGALRLVDFMALAGEADLRRREYPEHELLRIAECAAGEVLVEVEADLRPGFGAERRALRDRGPLGLRLERGAELVTLRASIPLAVGRDGVARGRARLREGEALTVSLAYDAEGPAVLPPLDEAREALRRTVRAWREIAARVSYDGPWREEVVRSVLALELLSYPPTGAIVAAPTTSLPERPGGDLNWDYRFCWLRDAALTVRALYGVGCTEAAEPFTGWLLHTTRLTRPTLRVLYDVYGRTPAPERIVPHLAGHRGAWPVRIGNAAAEQEQLDVYGEVVDAVAQAVRRGVRLDRDTQAMLRGFGEAVCRRWLVPDAGIWEPRDRPRLRTHSLVLGWVALTRLLELHGRGALRAPRARFEAERAAIRRLVDARGFDARLGSFVADLDGGCVDAALLLLGWYGYDDPASPRLRGTWRRIRERLSPAPGLLYRTEASAAAGEGAFGICSAWAVEHLARGGGTVDEAVVWLEGLLARGNDVGLFAEEIDPRTGAALGNFPQAFTHVGVVNAVLTVDERIRAERARPAPAPWPGPSPRPEVRP
jgi:GH15 family glucan-1,4-alpha-glucosidase